MALWQSETNLKDGMKVTTSVKVGKVLIKGLNSHLRETGRAMHLRDCLAKTEVDKDLWDKIMAERGMADFNLSSKQIFVAKDDAEAMKIVKTVPRGISDLKTKQEMDFERANRKPKIALI